MAFYLGSGQIDNLDNIIFISNSYLDNELAFLQKKISIYSGNISTIGSYAFAYCNSLTTVNLPKATSINYHAFAFCSYLTSVNLPKVFSIENYAFYNCSALASIELSQVTSIDAYTFFGCSALASISLPKVTQIGADAFGNCDSLISVNLPQVTSIGNSAFYSCNSLVSVSLPKATSIGSYVFSYCTSLTSVNLPLVTTIGDRTFYSCTSLTNVDCPKLLAIPGSCSLRVSRSTSTTSRYGAFTYCRSLQTISVPSVSSIGATAFAYCSYLTSFIGPRVFTVGGSYITSSSKSGTSIYRYSLYGGAFERCYRLSMVSLPSVHRISTYAFAFCYNLLSLYLMGSSIPSLVTTAFYSTPISTYTTSTGGVHGSIFVPASLYSSYLVASGWSVYSARIVSV